MKHLPQTPELVALAPRIIWFEPPEQALSNPIRFMAYLMTYGTIDELNIIKKYVGEDDFKEALINAPAGIFDKRSWSYWNVIYGFEPVPDMPKRKLS